MNFRGEKRSNQTHESKTDSDAKLARKGDGKEAKLSYHGNLLVENRNGLIVDATVLGSDGDSGERCRLSHDGEDSWTAASDGGRRQGL